MSLFLWRVTVACAGDSGREHILQKPIKGIVKNSVGASDSMVAGFTGEFVRSGNPC